MKYTDTHPPLQCFMRQSTWYKGAGKTTVQGVLWHSTGANNPYIKRYVQPDDNAPDRRALLGLIGVNRNGNDWNHIEREAGVHAFVGKLASGEVSAVQTGPWDKKAWGCDSGKKGSCNNGWIQFEICEDALTDQAYFDATYREAVELTAYLCLLYSLDPQGTVKYNGVNVPVILCHQDSYRLGLGSNHGDVYPWFNRYGKTMDDVRADVVRTMKGDDEIVTYEQWKEFMDRYLKERGELPVPGWAQNNGEWEAAMEAGIITKSTKPQDLCTKAEAAAFALRAVKPP